MAERDQWGSKCIFLLSLIGMSVGMGNVWRFPYVVYDNGGGAFMVPYIMLTIIAGRPMYLLELLLGQFSGYAQTKSFDGYPLAKGVGWAMVYACVSLASFNSLVLAYALVFLYYSLWQQVPWTQCDRAWADDDCYVKKEGIFPCRTIEQIALNKYKHDWLHRTTPQKFIQLDAVNQTDNDTTPHGITFFTNCINASQLSSYQFFYKRVLGFNPQSREQASYQAHLLLALAVGWCCVFACVHNGIRSLTKAIYATTVVPFVLMFILLTRMLTLPGASAGLKYYIVPQWTEVLSVTLWRRAAEEVILSLGLGYGTVICYAGFGRIRNKLTNDVEVVIATQFFASFGYGLVVFSVLGFMAASLQVHVEDVISSGFDIAFVAYPEAVSRIRNAHLWLVFFYVALLCMTLNAQCAAVQAVLSSVRDELSPELRPRRWLLAAAGCLAMMLCGMPMTRHVSHIDTAHLLVTVEDPLVCRCAPFQEYAYENTPPHIRNDGIYTMKMCDAYLGELLLPALALLEVCFVVHGYGLIRFSHDMCFMLKKWPTFFMKFLWKYLCPGLLLSLFITNAVFFRQLQIAEYDLPLWTICVGIMLVLIGLAIVVVFCVYQFYVFEWDCEAALEVSDDWGPRDPDERLRYHTFLKSQGFGAVAPSSGEATGSQGSSSSERDSDGSDQPPDEAVAVPFQHPDAEETPPGVAAALATAFLSTSDAQPEGSDRSRISGKSLNINRSQSFGPARTLVISDAGVTVVTTPLTDVGDKPPDVEDV
ncbi:sodium- and chloride-dependent glycine transporter 1-like [Amblyomma americanum]